MSEEDWDWLFWALGFIVFAAKRLHRKDHDKIERKARELVGKLAELQGSSKTKKQMSLDEHGITRTDEHGPIRCSVCGTEKKSKSERLPHGWKRLKDQVFCSGCWGKLYMLRAVTFPLAGPMDPKLWPELREALKSAWGDSTRIANWAMTELAKQEKPRLAEDKKLGPSPNPYLYPAARKLAPGMTPAGVVAVLNTVARKYNKMRLDCIWRGACSLPLFRYPVPYPVPAQAWSARYLSDKERVPLVSVPIAGTRFDLRLRGNPQMARQTRTFAQLVAGEAQRCELALYRKRVQESDNRPGLEEKQIFSRVMVKLVMWLPMVARSAPASKELQLARGKDCLWIVNGRDGKDGSDAWRINADQVRTWIIGHAARLQRLSEDLKLEKRRPKRERKAMDERVRLWCAKQNNRLDTFCHTASKMLAEFAVRNKASVVVYDASPTDYLPSFPWFKLEELLRYKLSERGIDLKMVDGTRNV